MRIVLDTKVLVSGLLNPDGAPGRVVDLILARRLSLLYDDRLLGKYSHVLARSHLNIAQNQVTAILGFFRLAGERITALPLPADLLSDPDDLPFAEVAVAGKADALITGNTKHFTGLSKHNVTVFSPTALIKQITSR